MRKKLAFALLLISIASKSFAFDCVKPPYDQTYQDPNHNNAFGTATNTCDCCKAHNNNPTGCDAKTVAACNAAPINSGLILLIIGGLGVGGFMINKSRIQNTSGLPLS